MPELPDVTVYVDAIRTRVVGHKLERAVVKSPFLLRTADPPLSAAIGGTVHDVRRLGKQIAVGVAGDLWLAVPLQIPRPVPSSPSPPPPAPPNMPAPVPVDN